MRVRLQAAYATTNRNPLGACAITGTGFPIDRAAHDGAARIRRHDRQHLRQHRHGRLPARERVRRRPCCSPALGRVVQDLLLWCTGGSRLSAAGRRLRAVEQHHAAEAQPGRARARARARQQGARPGERDSASPSTTRRSATSSTPRTTCSRSWPRCSTTRSRAVTLVAAAMAYRGVRSRADGGAGRGWVDYGDRARRHADARARRAVQDQPRDRVAARGRGWATAGRAAEPRCCREIIAAMRRTRHRSTTRRAWRSSSAREYFVRVRTTPGGPAPVETSKRSRASRERLAADEEWMRTAVGKLREAEELLRAAAASL